MWERLPLRKGLLGCCNVLFLGLSAEYTRYVHFVKIYQVNTYDLYLAVVPREKPHTGAAAREQPRDSSVIERCKCPLLQLSFYVYPEPGVGLGGNVLAGGLFYNARKIIGNIITLLLSDCFILINSEDICWAWEHTGNEWIQRKIKMFVSSSISLLMG